MCVCVCVCVEALYHSFRHFIDPFHRYNNTIHDTRYPHTLLLESHPPATFRNSTKERNHHHQQQHQHQSVSQPVSGKRNQQQHQTASQSAERKQNRKRTIFLTSVLVLYSHIDPGTERCETGTDIHCLFWGNSKL